MRAVKKFQLMALAALPLLASCASGGMRDAPQQAAAAADMAVPLTPVGVTVQATGIIPKDKVFRGTAQRGVLPPLIFADTAGMSLYTHDNDTVPGVSTCDAACTERWPVFVAAADAKPAGEWSIITRTDGTRQWAYKGKPLHRFIEDTEIGAINGIPAPPPATSSASTVIPVVAKEAPKPKAPWSLARYEPGAGVEAPAGFAVTSVWDASGEGLVDRRGQTIYAYAGQGEALCAAPCVTRWVPVPASQMARASGDFTLIHRADGIIQWAYKGRPLYTFEGDLMPGDANGIAADPRFVVALLKRYWMPASVSLQRSPENGKVLADANGMTLYRRTIYRFQVSGSTLPRGLDTIPAMGRAAGTKGCDATCQQTWKPYLAADDAVPTGFWTVLTREDGRRQWAYKGFALYTNVNDAKPGDTTGSLSFELFVNNGLQVASTAAAELAAALQSDNQTGLVWVHMYP